jgi:hypothetical protein
MTQSLASSLRRARIDALLSQAEMIRDHRDCGQRTEEARKMIRSVLADFALGKMTEHERQQILDVLSFARTPCIIETLQPVTTFQDEEIERQIETDLPKKQQSFFFMP